jgi:diacylglycerol kinase (ATP)
MPRKIRYIFNPRANLGRAAHLSAPLKSLATGSNGGEWIETRYPHHAFELAKEAADQQFDLVVALGGDGTLHEVLNGLMQAPAERRPLLGSIPVGSGNDFSYAIGMPTNDPVAAFKQVLNGSLRAIDIGLLEDDTGCQEYWSNAIGIGFDTVVTIRSRQIPIVKGYALYFAAVIEAIIRDYIPFQVQIKVDGQSWDGDYLMLVMCNGSREGGGFHVTPDGKPDDGILDYVTVNRVSRLKMLALLPRFMNGTHQSSPDVHLGRFEKMELTSNRPLQIHADGEILAGFDSQIKNLKVKILPGALKIVS